MAMNKLKCLKGIEREKFPSEICESCEYVMAFKKERIYHFILSGHGEAGKEPEIRREERIDTYHYKGILRKKFGDVFELYRKSKIKGEDWVVLRCRETGWKYEIPVARDELMKL